MTVWTTDNPVALEILKIPTLVLTNLKQKDIKNDKKLRIYTISSKVKNSSPFSEWLKVP